MRNRFSLFFGTFDAIVLMASIFILFPRENTEYIPTALQHFQWAVERFEAMAERNRLAAAARGVLNAIYVRLKKSLGIGFVNARDPAPVLGPGTTREATSSSQPDCPAPNGGRVAQSSATTLVTASGGPSNGPGAYMFGGSLSSSSTATATASGTTPIDPGLGGGGGGGVVAGSDWTLPEGFDWSSIQPVYAMADVAYNDLMGINCSGGETSAAAASSSSVPSWAGGAPLLNEVPGAGGGGGGGGGADPQPWLFGGDFGNDSVWNLLNQYPSPY